MEMGLLANYKQNLPESGGFEGLGYVFLERHHSIGVYF
jgi:hypothetical protein